MFRAYGAALFGFCVVSIAAGQAPDAGYTREQLQPLTKFRQQHRRAIDGRLCAAAFVQNRKAYTGCTEAPNPSGESGRPWCYVEPQVGALDFFRSLRLLAFLRQLLGDASAWNYCGSLSLSSPCSRIDGLFDFAAPGIYAHMFMLA